MLWIVAVMMIAAIPTVSAMDAPSMWMVQDGDDIDIMVNTNETSSGANAYIHFDPACVNITDVNFTDSPWPPYELPGWSNMGDYVTLVGINNSGVAPGEYRIARLTVECVGGDCTSDINITRAEPIGVVAYNTTYTCSMPVSDAVISIGDGTGVVTIPIVIDDAIDVGSCDVTLSFNPKIVMVAASTGGAMDCTYTNLENASDGWIRVAGHQGDNPGLSGQFTLTNVDFEPVAMGTCPLEITVTTFKDATPETVSMSYIVSNGVYVSSVNGDANNDGVVDTVDCMYIAKYVIGITGFETINEDAADVDGDGEITIADAMYLAKHIIGIAGFEELR